MENNNDDEINEMTSTNNIRPEATANPRVKNNTGLQIMIHLAWMVIKSNNFKISSSYLSAALANSGRH